MPEQTQPQPASTTEAPASTPAPTAPDTSAAPTAAPVDTPAPAAPPSEDAPEDMSLPEVGDALLNTSNTAMSWGDNGLTINIPFRNQ